jgi:hypothetical protein
MSIRLSPAPTAVPWALNHLEVDAVEGLAMKRPEAERVLNSRSEVRLMFFSRLRYKPGMQVYEFQSRCWALRALTLDCTGCELPAAYAPWDAENTGRALSALDPDDPLMRVLAQHGFFLTTRLKIKLGAGNRWD